VQDIKANENRNICNPTRAAWRDSPIEYAIDMALSVADMIWRSQRVPSKGVISLFLLNVFAEKRVLENHKAALIRDQN